MAYTFDNAGFNVALILPQGRQAVEPDFAHRRGCARVWPFESAGAAQHG
jgi:hypothetical protein